MARFTGAASKLVTASTASAPESSALARSPRLLALKVVGVVLADSQVPHPTKLGEINRRGRAVGLLPTGSAGRQGADRGFETALSMIRSARPRSGLVTLSTAPPRFFSTIQSRLADGYL